MAHGHRFGGDTAENRPIDAYMRALEADGLLTEAVREVRAPHRSVALDPADQRWQRIPMFLHVRAIKPPRKTN